MGNYQLLSRLTKLRQIKKLGVQPSKLFGLSCLLLLSGCAKPPADMWKCTATDLDQQHWVQYEPTRIEAATRVRDRCGIDSYRSTCVIRCIPPTIRWHCVAIDRGGNTWYWNSMKRAVAIRNALGACKKNTILGGCRVPTDNCVMT